MRRLSVCLALLAVLAAPLPAQAQNGNLPGSSLSPINTGLACTQLANLPAAGWNTMALDAGKVLPVNGCDSAYRSFARQVFWRNYWCSRGLCGNAAVPGTSNHGWGRAVDVPSWVRSWIDGHGPPFGWSKACSDAAHEAWHVLFCTGQFNRPDPGLNLKKPVLRNGSGGPGQHVWVLRLQKKLRELGYRNVTADGDFGPVTRHAVKRFQAREPGLEPDGVVGPLTWVKLRAPKAPEPEPPKPEPVGPVTGLDVSMHQGGIDFEKVRKANHEFVIQKASEGQDYIDPTFTGRRLDDIERANLVAGTYHFLRPRSDRTGAVEARWYAKVLRDVGGLERGMLPPVVDVESTTLSGSATCDYLHSFARELERRTDVEPIVYTYPAFASSRLGCGWLKDYRLWIAHYGVAKPTVPAPWSSYLMHQFTSTGSVPGIGGSADVNRLPGGKPKLALVVLTGEQASREPQIEGPVEQTEPGGNQVQETGIEPPENPDCLNDDPAEPGLPELCLDGAPDPEYEAK